MSNWNDFCKGVKQLTEKAIKKAEEITDITALRIKIKTLEGKIIEQYENLGALTYSNFKNGYENKEQIARIAAKIDLYLAEVASYKLKLAKIEAEAKKSKGQVNITPKPQENVSEQAPFEFCAPGASNEASNECCNEEAPTDSPLENDEDEKLSEALSVAIENRKVSTSLLQRKLGIGYGRALKLIDRMEQLGWISAPSGNEPRKVLVGTDKETGVIDSTLACSDTKAASECVAQNKPFSLPADDEDEKLYEAISLSFDDKKVSTSLLQRRLGVGYGRAAKIIDRMEELGWISAPSGNTARTILIGDDELSMIQKSLEVN